MTSPDHEKPTPARPYRVFGVPSDGVQGEQLLKTFDRAFEASAFARLVTAGGRYLHVRVESPATSDEQPGGRESVSDEPLHVAAGPGCLFKLLYVTTLLGGALVSLVGGFVGAFVIVVWIDEAIGEVLGPRAALAIALAIAGGLTFLVVKLHAAVFRESAPP
jgi:hypothetical protein